MSDETNPTKGDTSATLTIAHSPEKAILFERLVSEFNASRSAGAPAVRAVTLDTADLLEAAMDGTFAAISPDSSLWLASLDQMWKERHPESPALVGPVVEYARSPIVIAMREHVARDMGYTTVALGWKDLTERASEDVGFTWSHSAPTTASGLLATTAMFYAGAGKSSGLTAADVEAPVTLDYVRDIEATVKRYGGESEDQIVARLLREPSHALDAFVAQEQLVIHYNRHTRGEKLVAIYPKEGTFWMDHPLVLLDGAWVTAEQRQIFGEFATFVARPEQQRLILQEGYRAAMSESEPGEGVSLIRPDLNVNWEEPKALLTTPPPAVLQRIREAWQLTKRPANIYLVIDVSGSMSGEKIESAKQALHSFVDQIESDREQIALVAFSKDVREVEPLRPLSENRHLLRNSIDELRPSGETLLYDAIQFSLQRLQQYRDPDRINTIVVMSDGQDTGSSVQLEEVVTSVRQSDPPVLIFTVAYGCDADPTVLHQIAEAADGQAYASSPATIRRLYELMVQFF